MEVIRVIIREKLLQHGCAFYYTAETGIIIQVRGCSTVASMQAFQARDGSSILPTRTKIKTDPSDRFLSCYTRSIARKKTNMLHPIDIINKNNQLTGEVSDPEDANLKGLWHRGVHVLIYTDDGHVLVQKRSATMKRNPGKLDLSAGGFVDSGETPEQAAAREIKEETGLAITASQLKLVNLTRYNHRWKDGKTRKISRTIIYTYLYRIESSDMPLIAQREEVAWLGFLPLRSVQWLVRRHSLTSLGKLNGMYSYYAKLMRATTQALKSGSSS